MTLSHDEKRAMLRDVELRLAKETLVEHHRKTMDTIERSDQPLRLVKGLLTGTPPPPAPEPEPAPPPAIAGLQLAAVHQDQWQSMAERHHDQLSTIGVQDDLNTLLERQRGAAETLLTTQMQEREAVIQSATPVETEQKLVERHAEREILMQEVMQQLGENQTQQEPEVPPLFAATSADDLPGYPGMVPDFIPVAAAAQDAQLDEAAEYATSQEMVVETGMER